MVNCFCHCWQVGKYPTTFSPAALSCPFSCGGMKEKVAVPLLRSRGSAQQRLYALSQLLSVWAYKLGWCDWELLDCRIYRNHGAFAVGSQTVLTVMGPGARFILICSFRKTHFTSLLLFSSPLWLGKEWEGYLSVLSISGVGEWWIWTHSCVLQTFTLWQRVASNLKLHPWGDAEHSTATGKEQTSSFPLSLWVTWCWCASTLKTEANTGKEMEWGNVGHIQVQVKSPYLHCHVKPGLSLCWSLAFARCIWDVRLNPGVLFHLGW